MTIPKKKRREIVVDGTLYEYSVTGYVSVYIKNLITGKEFKWWEDWKPKWQQKIEPSFIRKLILENEV